VPDASADEAHLRCNALHLLHRARADSASPQAATRSHRSFNGV
jgi:hypothetical protein